MGVLIIGLAFYFIPTIIALSKNRKDKAGIFVVNILLGWTFIGWVVSLAWAVTEGKK